MIKTKRKTSINFNKGKENNYVSCIKRFYNTICYYLVRSFVWTYNNVSIERLKNTQHFEKGFTEKDLTKFEMIKKTEGTKRDKESKPFT